MAHLDEKGLDKVSGILKNYIVNQIPNIKTDGDGTKFLNDKGEYKEINAVNIDEVQWYGIEWEFAQEDPTCTRIGNLKLHRTLPIQNGLRGCVFKDGAVNYYLDPNDWSKKEDGTPSVLDGTDGVVRVDTGCTFYGKSETLGTTYRVMVSTTKIDDTWIEIPRLLIDAYKCTIDTTNPDLPKAVSVVNTTPEFRGGGNRPKYDKYLNDDPSRSDLGKPRTGISDKDLMREYARNNNSYVLSYEYYKWIFYWLPVIEYATFDLQKPRMGGFNSNGYSYGGLGDGVTSLTADIWGGYNTYRPLTPCGITNGAGNHSGEMEFVLCNVEDHNSGELSDITMKANRYRGFENPFGDIWTTLDGIVLNTLNPNTANIYICYNPEDYGKDIFNYYEYKGHLELSRNGQQYIKEFQLGESADILSSGNYATSNLYKCDRKISNYTDKTGELALFVGGCVSSGSYAGPAAQTIANPDCSANFYGFRTFCYYDDKN